MGIRQLDAMSVRALAAWLKRMVAAGESWDAIARDLKEMAR